MFLMDFLEVMCMSIISLGVGSSVSHNSFNSSLALEQKKGKRKENQSRRIKL